MACTDNSLFNAQPTERCAAAYWNLFKASGERAAAAKRLCDELWLDFRDLADENFVERFPFEFQQRWFEMYLGAALRRANLDVAAPKPGPDFRVSVEGRPIYIEAIAPTAGHPLHADAVQQPMNVDEEGHPVVTAVPHAQITLRLAGAFRQKADVFDRYRARGYVGRDDACVIAINLSEIPHAPGDADESWFRALYGVGDRFIMIDRAGKAMVSGREHRDLLQRAGGANEDVAPLLNPAQAAVSGVIGSAADAGTAPLPLGDEFLLMPHAAARPSYPLGFLPVGTEVRLDADSDGSWTVERIDYGAHPPTGPHRLAMEFEGARYEGRWAVAGRVLNVQINGHGCDIPIRGGDDAERSAMQIAFEVLRAYGGR